MAEPTSPQWEEIATSWIAFGSMMAMLAPEHHTVAAVERLREENPRAATLVETGLANMGRLIDEEVRNNG